MTTDPASGVWRLRPEQRVILAAPAGVAYVDLVAGLLSEGIVPVPVDPNLTPRERAVAYRVTQPSLVIEQADDIARAAKRLGVVRGLVPQVRPMHLTSGTTGTPKGVWSGLLSAPAAQAWVLEERDLWGFNEADRNLVVSSLHHSAPLRFALGTRLAGGSLVTGGEFDAAALTRSIATHRPTTAFMVPTHLARLFTWWGQAPVDLSSFRLLAHAGAPCPSQLKRRLMAAFPRGSTWEFYGATEGQFTACPSEEWLDRPGTVGRARPGRSLSADDDGTLWCTVPEHARFSYFNEPERTADAWRETLQGPAFSVGDHGRIDDEGFVYLDGRREDLIISGGVNVYPAEVEQTLLNCPGVSEIAVFGRPDHDWGTRVCAAVVGEHSHGNDAAGHRAFEAELRQYARAHLAPAKRPKDYDFRASLPHTSTGKVRRLDLL